MKNAEQSAHPTMLYNSKTGEAIGHMSGLTKREYFAAMAMQGILASKYKYDPTIHIVIPKDLATDAITFADQLLRQLES